MILRMITILILLSGLLLSREAEDSAKLAKLYKIKTEADQSEMNNSSREVFNLIDHINGGHEGSFSYHIIDYDSLNGHFYQIEFYENDIDDSGNNPRNCEEAYLTGHLILGNENTVDLYLDMNLNCNSNWVDGLQYIFSSNVSDHIIDWNFIEGNICSYGVSQGQSCDNVDGGFNEIDNILTFGNDLGGSGFGAFETDNTLLIRFEPWFDVNDPESMSPINIDYLIWDDGYDGTLVNGNGNISIDELSLFSQGALVMTVKDQSTNSMVYESEYLPNDDGSNFETTDGFKLLKGSVNYEPVVDVDRISFDLNHENADLYGESNFNVDSYVPHGWALTAKAEDTYSLTDDSFGASAGITHSTFGRDMEIRFTGEYDFDNFVEFTDDNDSTIQYIMCEQDVNGDCIGGSYAWISGARKYDIANHPDPMNPGDGSGFRIWVPFEVWDIEHPDGSQQIDIDIYDRLQNPNLDGNQDEPGIMFSFNPYNRMYTHFIHQPYTDSGDYSSGPSGNHTDFLTWNVVWWETQFNLGDNIIFKYRTELSSEDIYTFTPEQEGILVLSQPNEEYSLLILEEDEGSIYFDWQNTLENNSENEEILILRLEDSYSQEIVWEFLSEDINENENGYHSFDLDYDEIRQGMMEFEFATRDYVIHWDVVSYNVDNFNDPWEVYGSYLNDDNDSGIFFSASNGPSSFSIRNVVRRTHYVSAFNGDDSSDGLESSPFSSISHAIEMANDNDIIMVSEGVYNPIRINKYVTIIGENKENVIIDGNNSSTCIWIEYDGNHDERNFPVHLSGLTTQNGYTYYDAAGIGINHAQDVELSDINIIDNFASSDYSTGAGGIMLYNSSAYLKNVLVENNTGCEAGAIWLREENNELILENSMILNNYSCEDSSENKTGGIAIWSGSSASLNYVTMAFNQSSAIGLGDEIAFEDGEEINLNISSSTFFENEDGAIRSHYDNGAINVNVTNSIMWDNGTYEAMLNASTEMAVSYSNISGIIDINAGGLDVGDGVISEYPYFINPSINDFNLDPESSCIDAGDPNSTYDPDGTIADIGSHYYHQLSPNIVGITESGGIPGDTVSVSVYADLGEDFDINAFEVTIAGLGGGNISAVGVDTSGTIMSSDWIWSYFISDSGNVVMTAGAGAEPVEAMGSLFNVHFVIDESSGGGFFPVFVTSALFNEDEEMQFETDPGGVMVLGIGDVSSNGDVTALDASLILQHLVGLDTLSADQQSVGDVTRDNSLSALDAVVILDHVVGLVDDLPYSPDNAELDAMIAIAGGATEPGSTFEVPIRLTDGSNVRSFEFEFSYDVEALSVQQVVWDTEVLSGLQVLDNQQDGIVKVSAAGMGSSLASGSQTLGYIEFRMDDFFNGYETSVTLSRSRLNESEVMIDGSMALYTNSMLVVSDWGDGGVPVEFALNQNYPNPFNPSTLIRYQLPEQTNVTISIYDLMGRSVRTLIPGESQKAGYRQVLWNATNDFGQPVSAGMYIYTIQAGEFRQTKKMVLIK